MRNIEERAAFDHTIRRLVYDHAMKQGALPSIAQTAICAMLCVFCEQNEHM